MSWNQEQSSQAFRSLLVEGHSNQVYHQIRVGRMVVLTATRYDGSQRAHLSTRPHLLPCDRFHNIRDYLSMHS